MSLGLFHVVTILTILAAIFAVARGEWNNAVVGFGTAFALCYLFFAGLRIWHRDGG